MARYYRYYLDGNLQALACNVAKLTGSTPQQVLIEALKEYCTHKLLEHSDLDTVWNLK